MRIVLTGGVTGGHIYPAIAIGDKFREADPSCEIIYIASGEPLEKSITEKAGYELFEVESSPFYRNNPLLMAKTLTKTLKGRAQALRIMKDFKPDVVISTGSFVSVPVVMAGASFGARIFLHEQNGFPGVSNKFLSRYAEKVFLGFESARQYFKDENKVIYSGNPVRKEFSGRDQSEDRKALGIPEDDFAVLVFGGSLGSATTNSIGEALARKFADKDGFTLIWGTGNDYYEEIKTRLEEEGFSPENVRVLPYISDMPEMLSAADLSISRSGALSVAETTMAGRAAIFIPSPNVTEDHQYYNAKAVADIGGAYIVREENGVEGCVQAVEEIVEKLDGDRELLKKMQEASAGAAPVNATEIIYENIVSGGNADDIKEESAEYEADSDNNGEAAGTEADTEIHAEEDASSDEKSIEVSDAEDTAPDSVKTMAAGLSDAAADDGETAVEDTEEAGATPEDTGTEDGEIAGEAAGEDEGEITPEESDEDHPDAEGSDEKAESSDDNKPEEEDNPDDKEDPEETEKTETKEAAHELSEEDREIAERIRLRKIATERKRRRQKRRLAASIVLIVSVITFFILSFTSIFTVDSIEVRGNTHYSAEEIISMGHAVPGKNLIYQPGKKEIIDYLERNPYIKSAKVKRKLPSTLVIEVEERTQLMALKYDDDYLILDREGILLQKSRSKPKLTLIEGNVITKIKLGENLGTKDEELLKKSIAFVQKMGDKDLYYVKVDLSDARTSRAYVYDTLLVRGDYDILMENMENGRLHKVLDRLFSDSIRRGTITFNEDGTASFMPII